MEVKTHAPISVEVKDAVKGIVHAQFATYGEEDHHKDVHQEGCFEDGAAMLVSAYNHGSWSGGLPTGKAVLRDTKSGPVAEMQFFMNTEHGREAFETVKSVGDLQQWSYGFDVVESERGQHKSADGSETNVRFLKKMKVHEISPVLVGAGKSTQTLAVKAYATDGEPGKMKMFDHLAQVLSGVEAVVQRSEEIKALRETEGKDSTVAESTKAMLTLIDAQMARIKAVLAETVSEPTTTPEDHSLELLHEQFKMLSEELES